MSDLVEVTTYRWRGDVIISTSIEKITREEFAQRTRASCDCATRNNPNQTTYALCELGHVPPSSPVMNCGGDRSSDDLSLLRGKERSAMEMKIAITVNGSTFERAFEVDTVTQAQKFSLFHFRSVIAETTQYIQLEKLGSDCQ